MTSLLVLLLMTPTGDPTVDSYPEDVVEGCYVQLAGPLAMKRAASNPETARIYDEQIRAAINGCFADREKQRQRGEEMWKQLREEKAAQAAKERAAGEAMRTRQKSEYLARVDKENAEALAASRREEELLGDQKLTHPAYSALLCHSMAVKKHATTEVKREQHYARTGGGIVDKAKLYALQQKQREADENIARAKMNLGIIHVKPLQCSSGKTALYAKCMADSSGENCSGVVSEMLTIVQAPDFWEP